MTLLLRLARVLRYGAVALIMTWSLLALAIYALLGAVSGWVAADSTANGWIAWSSQMVDQSGGFAVGILWLAGTLVIFVARGLIRRLTA
ncbi:hypothetical protein MRS76_23785 [Rhizobiaceae bacterium n13]|uniref:Uncharacterized protein n=1 Tax=Ferirhizobium litorale TaxID=2927786 RepID=A0AAE3QLH6_9HYPH|nr:hypothetical protein [Fererhizobium litorale]MDI7864952.1 hypothetical protein [Fererhizobium litorale]MDI7925248.1 hypothetical protein [Fererhizobium litorale]